MTKRILHIITSLNPDGAQQAMLRILPRMPQEQIRHEVISLTNDGPLAADFRAAGIAVNALKMKAVSAPLVMMFLARLIHRANPGLIQTWLYHGDLLGGIVGRLAGNCPIAWNIRHSNLDREVDKKTTIWCAKACSRLSRSIPAAIICNSSKARAVHIGYGYDPSKFHVIPNGYDMEQFRPVACAKLGLLQELGIADVESRLVGLIGRYHPQKDHRMFFEAMAAVMRERPNLRLVLCGQGVDRDNEEIGALLQRLQIEKRCHLLGQRNDVVQIMQALDVLVMSSCGGEGFPNVVAEAMACGVPCLVTDVGDAAEIVGDCGKVVQPRDPMALARAITELLNLSHGAWTELGLKARERIRERYSIESVVAAYGALYDALLEGTH